jgi:hypothetical protein
MDLELVAFFLAVSGIFGIAIGVVWQWFAFNAGNSLKVPTILAFTSIAVLVAGALYLGLTMDTEDPSKYY